MHFVGIDLAWGERARTGLAVLDDAGTLIHLSAATTDDTIAAALAPFLDDECLVAIDAPLIVTNATGNRPCEAALNRDFARFEAGAHPSNTSRPEMRDTPRGPGWRPASTWIWIPSRSVPAEPSRSTPTRRSSPSSASAAP
ncbi:DUF429 domain-containing protein [Raineyella fluvialis]|uniref:DUF429 domain-containing protein n=1 Tax=Raineyella fluvialis TaxID=2662261 RepID=UPI0024110973|nr:DUF429 domain-containing protein [Raineyella fluvialis]